MNSSAAGSRPLVRRMVDFGIRYRFRVRAAIDCVLIALATVGAVLLRFDFDLASPDWVRVAAIIPVFCLVQLAVGITLGVYVGRARFGSFDEVAHLTLSLAASTAIVWVLNLAVLDRLVPSSVPIGTGVGALVATMGARYVWRLGLERRRRPDADKALRVIVFGAGEGGAQAITAMLHDPQSPFLPVALLDDDASKVHLEITGVKMAGNRYDVAQAAEQYEAEAIVIAIPTADPPVVREVADAAGEAGLRTFVLPRVENLLTGDIAIGDIRPITEADLLGRGQVDTDVASIAGYLTSKRVMVTGAGGSIGSELCRQIHQFGPSELILLERDESALHAVQLSMDGRGQLEDPNLVVADIRDTERINEIFEEHQPQVVFHAAALKHVPLLEMHPEEGHKTNVVGTHNLLCAAKAVGVERFVNISTDKAADPANVLGKTKRLAEQLTAQVATETDGTFMSVRFGNVLGSRGSVLTTFRTQITAGGPVTVTHPDVTRYFMTVQEAVQLVIQAAAIGKDGQALVLDMGKPVRIADVAKRLVEQNERPVKITYTGLRHGEKLHEVLFGENETGTPTGHDLISCVIVPPIAYESLDRLRPESADDPRLFEHRT